MNARVFFYCCCAPLFLLPSSAQTVLYSNGFETGSLSDWINPSGLFIAVDPTDSSNHVMSTPGANSRTTTIRKTFSSQDILNHSLRLNVRMNADYVGDSSWNANWMLLTAASSTATGYGFMLGRSTVKIWKVTNGFSSNFTEIASSTLSAGILQAGWNDLQFDWAAEGSLRLYVNGTQVLSAIDTTYQPSLYQISERAFLNNSGTAGQAPSGRVIYYDNLVVTAMNVPLCESDFESDNLNDWLNESSYVTAVDRLNAANKALSTPGGNSRTTILRRAVSSPDASGHDLQLTLRFNKDAAGDSSWNTSWLVLTGNQSSSPGYGFNISQTTVKLWRADQGIGSAFTQLTTATLASGILQPGWNTAQFIWRVSGSLKLVINGTLVLSGTGRTYAPACAQIGTVSFLNNSATAGQTPSGRVLYFDDISVEVINPYWAMCNSSVARVLAMTDAQRTADHSAGGDAVFWLAWGYTSPASDYYHNPALLSTCVATWNLLVPSYNAANPATAGDFWNYMPMLESLWMMMQSDGVDYTILASWKNALLPYMQNEYENYNSLSTAGSYPNADAQHAAIMYLAYLIYGDTNYKYNAALNVSGMANYFKPTLGGWHYYRGSTPISMYHSFEAMFLGRYYQLSRDPVASAQLIQSANFYPYVYTCDGAAEFSSAPWWKQTWAPAGGAIHSAEIVTWLTQDPHNRWYANFRSKTSDRFYWNTYSGQAWDAGRGTDTPDPEPFPDNFIVADDSIVGVRGRNGSFSWVGCLGKKALSVVGCLLSNSAYSNGYDGYIQMAHIGITVPGVTNTNYYNQFRLIADPTREPTTVSPTISRVTGDGYAAVAINYVPQRMYSSLTAYNDWIATEVWLFTPNCVVGGLRVTAQSDNPTAVPQGIVRMGPSSRPYALNGNTFNVGNLYGTILASDFPAYSLGLGSPDYGETDQRPELRLSWTSTPNISSGQKFGYIVAFSPNTPPTATAQWINDTTFQIQTGTTTYWLQFPILGAVTVTHN